MLRVYLALRATGISYFYSMGTTYSQIIIGAGFAGLCAAIKLKQAGEHNFVLLERNAHLGGTWYDNHYPGAACDVESHLYSFSFEPKADWSRNFGPQQEILTYMEHCATKYDVARHIQYSKTVTGAVFNQATGTWVVSTATGEEYTGRVLLSCSGSLSQPALPAIKGLSDFKGPLFHSAQWDRDFDYRGKTVAVIGTGASAIQLVPAIAPDVKQLLLFQRTAPWILPKPDAAIGSLRRWLYTNLPFMQRLYRYRLYWQHEALALGFLKLPVLMKIAAPVAKLFIKRSVNDKALQQKLVPNYSMGCKRILLSNNYYPALNRSNVQLVTDGIAEVNATGVRTTNGVQHTVDAIVLATGFAAAEQVIRYTVKGLNGRTLSDDWRNGAEAYLGTMVSGYPNMFMVIGPNTGLGHSSMLLMIEAQVNLIMDALRTMQQTGARYVNVKANVQQQYTKQLQQKLANTVWQTGGCVSWYQLQNGKNIINWPGFTFTFMQRTKMFEADNYEIVV